MTKCLLTPKVLFYFLTLINICTLVSMQAISEIDLQHFEKRIYSQNGEDGVIEKIFSLIGTTNKYYVEFGASDGHALSNTKYLREKYKWTGLLLEGSHSDIPAINLHKEFITAENICQLFAKYHVPKEFDLISIDIDRNDFYVWKALSKHYKPRVVVIEFNPRFNFNEDKIIKYAPFETWSHRDFYFGGSILAFFKLGRSLGYSLVYQESAAANLFFIRNDILAAKKLLFKNINNVAKLYRATPNLTDPDRSQFISSNEALKLIA